jgi:uncharacterized RDD family membrane protein YckC
MEPADRSQRLFAAVADACPLLLLVVLAAYSGNHRSTALAGLATVLFLALGCVQLWLLTARGQTLGKMLFDIRVVRVRDKLNGGFIANVLLRVMAVALLGMIPYLGALFAVADLLFIFRSDRRCLHDLIAGTFVIKGSSAVLTFV